MSRDRGETWTQPMRIQGWKEKLRDGMTGIAATRENGGDALVMVFETTHRGPLIIEAAISCDNGVYLASSPRGLRSTARTQRRFTPDHVLCRRIHDLRVHDG